MNELDGIIQSINSYSNDLAYNVREHLWFVRGLNELAYYLSLFCQSQITWVFILIYIFWSTKADGWLIKSFFRLLFVVTLLFKIMGPNTTALLKYKINTPLSFILN